MSEFGELKEIVELVTMFYKPVKNALVDLANEYWSTKWAKKIARNVAAFYKTLIREGIDREFAMKLTMIHVMNAKLILEGLHEVLGKSKVSYEERKTTM